MTQMQYRTLGRTGLRVSSVGFGTSQLRRVPATQAVDTLLKGFDLGVNIVHVAPDYEGAEDLVATAVARSSKKVIVACNGYDVQGNKSGRARLFERLFETTCRKLKTDRLDLYGIASVDDREAFNENVWGRGGMIEFLQKMKAKGRLGATFCTCHGKPEFTRRLIESGAFDAVMLSYTDLGFHMLTLNPPANWHFEDIGRTRAELFPLCAERGVGLMIMLPFGGGMILKSKAFPPAPGAVPEVAPEVTGADVLRSILANPEVSTVLPGTACVEEAEENALAGHPPVELKPERTLALGQRLSALQASLCSRCGVCEPTCSQQLPISWLFRAGYMSVQGVSPYETWEDVEYFRLHPRMEAPCATCTTQTCACPAGLDIREELGALHGKMVDGMKRGLVPPPPDQRPEPPGNGWFAARVVRRELPDALRPGENYLCRLNVENAGKRPWHPPGRLHRSSVSLKVWMDDRPVEKVAVRHHVFHGHRTHFVFNLTPPPGRPRVNLRLQLVREHPLIPDRKGLVLFDGDIPVREGP